MLSDRCAGVPTHAIGTVFAFGTSACVVGGAAAWTATERGGSGADERVGVGADGGVGVGVGVGGDVGVDVGSGEGTGEGVAVGAAAGVADGEEVAVGSGVGVGVGGATAPTGISSAAADGPAAVIPIATATPRAAASAVNERALVRIPMGHSLRTATPLSIARVG
ncbi:hypothetical protein [Curtobacterium sp. PhB130]|uniref:hypothetical protein n=1 Tax=Curtobacterium sp. PhB130 TaxID=2485178 RepID=UPI0011CDCD04|nr:hypothetical protein [Curtobacterium sp. PhB130]